jgi:hypothetical protein
MQKLITSNDATYTTEQKVTAMIALTILSGCPGIALAPYTVSLHISGVPNAVTRPIIQSLITDLTALQQSTTARIRHAAIRALSCLACLRRDHEMNATVSLLTRISGKLSSMTVAAAAAGELNLRTFQLPAENTLVRTLLVGLLTIAGVTTDSTSDATSQQPIAAPVPYATAVLQSLKHCKLRVSDSQLALVLSTLFRLRSDSASTSNDTPLLQSAALEYIFTTISRDATGGSNSACTSWLLNSIVLQRGSLAGISHIAQTTILTHLHELHSLLLRSGQLLEAMDLLWSQCYKSRNVTAGGTKEDHTAHHQQKLIQLFLSLLTTIIQHGGQYVVILRSFVMGTITAAMLVSTPDDSLFGTAGTEIWSSIAICISLLYTDAEGDTDIAASDSWLHEQMQTHPSITLIWLIAKLGELGVWQSSTTTTVPSRTVSPLYNAITWSCDMTKTLSDNDSGAAIDAQLIKALRQTSDTNRQTWLMLILNNLVRAATDNDSNAKHTSVKQTCLVASAWRYSILSEVLTSVAYSASTSSDSIHMTLSACTDVQATVLIPSLIEHVCTHKRWSDCSSTVVTQLLKAYTITTDANHAMLNSNDTVSTVYKAVVITALTSCKHAVAVLDGRVSNYAAAAAHISIANSSSR